MPASEEEGEDLVFLSPDESPVKDQGASPTLRRSNRKRKSVTTTQDMSKSSSSKKKKCSPNKVPDTMPKTTRTPVRGSDAAEQNGPKEAETADKPPNDFASLLMAMEARLSSKLDANKRAVNEAVKMSKLNSDALDALEEKVDATDEILKETLARVEAQEERVLARVEEQVKNMVRDQLKEAGFDTQLSAGDLSTVVGGSRPRNGPTSYAEAAAVSSSFSGPGLCKERRQETKFWECRRSLRLWPIPEPTQQGLKTFLQDKLNLEEDFIEEDLGQVTIKRNIERRPKNKDEVCVTFESKEIRDRIKAQGPQLAGCDAGMRLQIPDNLQKDFKALMAVAYDLKQVHKNLRRNVKFDEENLGLYMDIQTEREEDWKRIRPHQAHKAAKTRKSNRNGPADLGDDEIESLLEEAAE